MTPLQKGQPRTQGLQESGTDCCLVFHQIYIVYLYIYKNSIHIHMWYIYIYIYIFHCLLACSNSWTSCVPLALRPHQRTWNSNVFRWMKNSTWVLTGMVSMPWFLYARQSLSFDLVGPPAPSLRRTRNIGNPVPDFKIDWVGRKCSAENLLNKRAEKCSRLRSPEWKDRFRFSKREILFPVRRPCWSVDRHIFNLESKKRREEREKIYTSIDPK